MNKNLITLLAFIIGFMLLNLHTLQSYTGDAEVHELFLQWQQQYKPKYREAAVR